MNAFQAMLSEECALLSPYLILYHVSPLSMMAGFYPAFECGHSEHLLKLLHSQMIGQHFIQTPLFQAYSLLNLPPRRYNKFAAIVWKLTIITM